MTCATCDHERLFHVPSIHLPSGRAYCVKPDCPCMAFAQSLSNACDSCGKPIEDHHVFCCGYTDCDPVLVLGPAETVAASIAFMAIMSAPDLPRECEHDHSGGPCDCYSDIHQPGLD